MSLFSTLLPQKQHLELHESGQGATDIFSVDAVIYDNAHDLQDGTTMTCIKVSSLMNTNRAKMHTPEKRLIHSACFVFPDVKARRRESGGGGF